jgi:coiled-coil domain-containing protein 55
MNRSGLKPGAMGLMGSAGLQVKGPKKFGLQRPKKLAPAAGFGDGEVEEVDVASEIERMSSSKQAKAAAEAARQAALAEDPSVYDYDGTYDSMQAERARQRELAQPKERKTRYIGAMCAAPAPRPRCRAQHPPRPPARAQHGDAQGPRD